MTLPHLSADGQARMVDVSEKAVTTRIATAAGRLLVNAVVIDALRDGSLPKGDALAVARIAAISAVKRTSDLLPLCHPLPITGVDIDLVVGAEAVEITVSCRADARTGAEMEALTGVCVAGLAVHDMVKALDPAAVLADVRLLSKSGGRSGEWTRP
ncbi:MAG: cyclic pyranopterin monophosphate synthase MoaC [Actinomycetes bacterium]